MLAIVLVGSASSLASAAPAAPSNLSVSQDPLTPYVSGGCLTDGYHTVSCYAVKGKADPGVDVIVTIRDQNGFTVQATTKAAAKNDSGAGIQAGDWSTSPNVTNLGLHGTTPSILTFTAVAKAADGTLSPESAPVTATKIAATPNDLTAPTVSSNCSGNCLSNGGETNWCRNTSCNSNFQTLGLQGSPCHRGTTSPPFPNDLTDVEAVTTYVAGNAGIATDQVFSQAVLGSGRCSVDMLIKGTAEDNTNASYGFASEISDIIVTVTRVSDNILIKEYHPAVRRGTFAAYNVALKITDYEDNKQYRWQVRVYDAWGHLSPNSPSGTFTVTP